MAPDPWLQVKDLSIRQKHLKLFATDSVALLNHFNAVRVAYAGGMGETPPTQAEVRAQMDQLIQRLNLTLGLSWICSDTTPNQNGSR